MLCTNFSVATVAEINSGSQFFSDAPLAQTPANFGPKRRFLVTQCVYKVDFASFNGCKNTQGVPNFLDAPLAQTPANFGLKCCFSVI